MKITLKKIIYAPFILSKRIFDKIFTSLDKKTVKNALNRVNNKLDAVFLYDGGILSDYLKSRKNVSFFFDFENRNEIIAILNNNFPHSVSETVNKANDAVNHKFETLGAGPIQFADDINWFTDFKGGSWKYGYYKDINKDYFSDNFQSPDYIADINLPWELNKHRHFVDMGKAYFITGSEKYAVQYFKQIEDWIDKNPYKMGVNWAQNLIVAQRAINWIFALFLFLNSPNFPENTLRKIVSMLYLHAKFIFTHFEYAEKTDNNLIGCAGALYFLSCVFPEFKESKKWKKKSLKILAGECKKQIYDDGVFYEQSTGGHRYVVEFLLLVVLIKYINGDEEYKELLRKFKLEKMLEFIMHMTQPNGTVQPISDADSARVWDFDNAGINDHRSALAIGSILFERGDFKFAADSAFEEILWFLGKSGYRKFVSVKATQANEKSKAFPEGGYYALRDKWGANGSWMFFDAGFIGMGDHPDNMEVACRGHSDILNFGLAKGADIFITDNGSYTYTGSKFWHDYFRGASHHNVLTVDGADMCALTKYRCTSYRARPKLIKWESGPIQDHIIALHDGYHRLPDKITVIREVIFDKQDSIIIIKDRAQGEKEHHIALNLHLYPGVKIKKLDNTGEFELSGQKNKIYLKIFSDNFDINIDENFYSPSYGVKIPSKKISIEKKIKLPTQIYTFINLKNETFRQSLLELDDKYL